MRTVGRGRGKEREGDCGGSPSPGLATAVLCVCGASSSQDRDSSDTDDSKPSDNSSVTAKPKTWESGSGATSAVTLASYNTKFSATKPRGCALVPCRRTTRLLFFVQKTTVDWSERTHLC